ncbi:MAG: MFS transporter [Gammaproteobacteria bacterium]|nr:MFS transporter [Gammaproteobacteria bacterium]
MDNRTRLLLASVVAIATTSFGFIVRAFLITEWGDTYNLTETQKGALQGAGLFPFAVSIILTALVVDRVGYGRAMAVAWIGHVVAAVVTMTATSYTQIYLGTLLFALANGIVEAVTNPAVATLYPQDKVRYLNILHAGWPGGLVFGGLLFIVLGETSWQMKIGLFLLPAVIYGLLMLRCQFPVQERVSAGVSYQDMLREFGWGGCLIVSYFIAGAIDAVLAGVFSSGLPTWLYYAFTLLPAVLFAARVRSPGRPVFLFMLLIMIVLATTELGTDSWVTDLLTPVLQGSGAWVLVYTSAIMFVLRIFSAGPLLRRLTPVGLLLICSLLAAAGLALIANAGAAASLVFLAATLYGAGKSFFWPTTLGIVSEQFPRGGALTLNAMGGMGMIAVGVLGAPFLGAIVDRNLDQSLRQSDPAIHARVAEAPRTFPLLRGLDAGPTTIGPFQPLDKARLAALPAADRTATDATLAVTRQQSLLQFAILPVIMAICYLLLLLHFRGKGGYKPMLINEP